MTAAARVVEAPRPDPVIVFAARCQGRATLWQAGEFDLHEAVDALQAAAVASGLVAELGQDAVQRLMATAFHAVRDDFIAVQDASSGALKDAWSAPGWREAAAEYHRKRAGSTLIVEPEPERLAQSRRLLATSTLRAAKYLVRENNPEQLQRWLERHSADERKAIQKHLGRRACR